jgi:O-antigen/teichoic acid export membrane protein
MIPYLPLAMASAIATATNNNTITATYGASMRYQAILGMFVFAFNTVLLPQMAAISDNHKEQLKLRNNLKRIAPWAFFSYSVITISIWSFIPYIDNGKYPDLPTIFLIMAITPGLSLIGTPYINKLLIAGMARTVLLCMSCGLIANLLIFFIFDSKNELTPALGSLFAYLVITISLISFEVARNRKSCLK